MFYDIKCFDNIYISKNDKMARKQNLENNAV